MNDNSHICSVCNTTFQLQFRYQAEVRRIESASGTRETTEHFCSQDCLDRSLRATHAAPTCDACGVSFTVEMAAQVLFIAGQRQYACSAPCRSHLIARRRAPTLGERVAEASVARAHRTRPAVETAPESPAASARGTAPAEPASVVRLQEHPKRRSVPVSWRRIDAELARSEQVLAVFNHKGGTGKTTTALTVAAGLAARGRKVLLVDTDGQGNVAVSLGLEPSRTLYHVLVMGQPYTDAVVSARPGLDLLPSNETLAAAELYLAGRPQRDRVLRARLESARPHYDHIIVDCSPSLSLMSQNALVFADAVLCPVACDYLSLVGVRQVLRTIKQVNRHLNHPVRLWGVLPTLYDSRAVVCREALDTLREHFGNRCLDPIRSTIKVKEAPAHARTLGEYAPDSNAAKDYERVLERLISSEVSEREAYKVGGLA